MVQCINYLLGLAQQQNNQILFYLNTSKQVPPLQNSLDRHYARVPLVTIQLIEVLIKFFKNFLSINRVLTFVLKVL